MRNDTSPNDRTLKANKATSQLTRKTSQLCAGREPSLTPPAAERVEDLRLKTEVWKAKKGRCLYVGNLAYKRKQRKLCANPASNGLRPRVRIQKGPISKELAPTKLEPVFIGEVRNVVFSPILGFVFTSKSHKFIQLDYVYGYSVNNQPDC